MKIARITEGCPKNKKGHFKSVHNRTKYLNSLIKEPMDLYIIRYYYPFWIRLLKRDAQKQNITEEYFIYDSVKYTNIWVPFCIIDYILENKLFKRPLLSDCILKKKVVLFKDYDIILCHSIRASYCLGIPFLNKYKKKYIATFHGSEIHTSAFKSKTINRITRKIIEKASENIFVSNKLLSISNEICKTFNKSVIYNGLSPDFSCVSEIRKNELKLGHGITSKYVIAFIGGLVPIKNIVALPALFIALSHKIKDVEFWIIGDGPQRNLLQGLNNSELKLIFWGNVDTQEMPDLYRMIDVVVIPSLNEGLPNVALEGLMCGCKVVGSNRGGILEAIGVENCVEIDENFTGNMSQRIVEIIDSTNCNNSITSTFSWEIAAKKEYDLIKKQLDKN